MKLFTISRTHDMGIEGRLSNIFAGEDYNITVIKRGSALKFGIVAEKVANIYIRNSYSHEWDTASGHALVLAAGGKVVSLDSDQPLKYNKRDLKNPGFIAYSSEQLYNRLCSKFSF